MINEIANLYCWLWAGLPFELFRKLFPEPIKAGDYRWSKYDPLFQPKVRLVDGTWSGSGTLWRRRRREDNRWEYQQDPETLQESMDRVI
ncbi:hypothetical protein CO659_12665 [Rhizobium sp. S9]|uniref:hypothetical protein n=1 Tax=Rhizobium sp. S9 TaxID=2035454 RepID=UPI000BE8A6C8|nr:hypothetical protein [Rhizobium sp. S9]PDS97511.1 hypothetical protein CO659_12665 [Rhizobium sp. S9]